MTTIQDKLIPAIEFMLFDWLSLGDLLGEPRFAEHSGEACRELLRGASEIAAQFFEPANRVSDVEEPYVDVAGEVVLPAETHRAFAAYRDFGVMGASHNVEFGGSQLPRLVELAVRVVFSAAGPNVLPTLLSEANASLILEHGTEAQRRAFAVPQIESRFTGTMAMSESQAGSSLADILTRATPDGPRSELDPLGARYRLVGEKMWISGAEHTLADNIVHLVLAKIPLADGTLAATTSALSLFIVPKFLVDSDSGDRERNDVRLISLNHKLGNRGIPNTALAFGQLDDGPRGARGAIGYLVGEPGEGLSQMFHMMNAARTEIGLLAASIGFAGFAVSLDYAKWRRQGRARGGTSTDSVPIIQHADVKRMLLAQKSYAEGGIALALYVARLLDEQRTGDDDTVQHATALLEILTPVLKSWPSEWCLEGNSLAIQVLGGAGYTRDYPVEQYWRDQRLNMIHEGTHGVQALDLLGRKVRQRGGESLTELGEEVARTVAAAGVAGMADEADSLAQAWSAVLEATDQAWATGDASDALANATPYLQAFGHVCLAWVHLDLALAALSSKHAEAAGRIATMRYFFAYEVPRVYGWLSAVIDKQMLCRDLDPAVL
ncbi:MULTISPECIES: acyl-CoA dehydrogenase [unclassified Nocardioides]|uniref:acyl-CoA dehydrogenase n=1 Tax=unclassified Nocardioides TaxID=2615069 RepID=UPI0006FE1B7E|nr:MULTISPECIES: acyl-CoA dehydrogenase [unclassified Nocardioides]KRA29838.1 acyl-CoA dehydrogenase [Nocardioides sp. Root614]KRA86761.1 acyl-CoA dehydrogenase [Nocardioides sp. Root682]